jgi:hypothetical protein
MTISSSEDSHLEIQVTSDGKLVVQNLEVSHSFITLILPINLKVNFWPQPCFNFLILDSSRTR